MGKGRGAAASTIGRSGQQHGLFNDRLDKISGLKGLFRNVFPFHSFTSLNLVVVEREVG